MENANQLEKRLLSNIPAPDSIQNEYVFEKKDINRYALGCKKIAEFIIAKKPDEIICPLRGGYPPTTIINEICDYKSNIKYVPTSDCVEDKKGIIYSALETSLENFAKNGNKNPHLVTIDTAIKGSSTRQFKGLLLEYLPKIISKLGIDITYSIVKLWLNPEEASRSKKLKIDSRKKGSIMYNDAVFYVNDLLCEDKPELLGIDYPYCIGQDKKSAFLEKVGVQKKINVKGEGGEIREYLPIDCTTSQLFIRIVQEAAKNEKGN